MEYEAYGIKYACFDDSANDYLNCITKLSSMLFVDDEIAREIYDSYIDLMHYNFVTYPESVRPYNPNIRIFILISFFSDIFALAKHVNDDLYNHLSAASGISADVFKNTLTIKWFKVDTMELSKCIYYLLDVYRVIPLANEKEIVL
jgi:hypothetical protein